MICPRHKWQQGTWFDRCQRCGFTWPNQYAKLRPWAGRARPGTLTVLGALAVGMGGAGLFLGADLFWSAWLILIGAVNGWTATRLAEAHEYREELIDRVPDGGTV